MKLQLNPPVLEVHDRTRQPESLFTLRGMKSQIIFARNLIPKTSGSQEKLISLRLLDTLKLRSKKTKLDKVIQL